MLSLWRGVLLRNLILVRGCSFEHKVVTLHTELPCLLCAHAACSVAFSAPLV